MTSTRTRIALALTTAVLALAVAPHANATTTDAPAARTLTVGAITLPACEAEDSVDCRWDAGVSGLANGGESFTTVSDAHGLAWTFYDNGSTLVTANGYATHPLATCDASGIAPVPCQSDDQSFYVEPFGTDRVAVVRSDGSLETFDSAPTTHKAASVAHKAAPAPVSDGVDSFDWTADTASDN